MKVAFVSNYLSPHQLPFCLAMDRQEAVDFTFIATRPVGEERIILGYDNLDKKYPFVICAYENDELLQRSREIIDEADIAIMGSAPDEMIRSRIKCNKITFRFSERQLKHGFELLKYPVRFLRWHKVSPNKKHCLLLCASAYAAYDFSLFGLYKDRAYRWGYFPETKEYENIDQLISNKEEHSILWVGRLLDWKRPKMMLQLATILKEKGYKFHINIIGKGPLEDELKRDIYKRGLQQEVTLIGGKKPEDVRCIMEKSEIFITTSNRQEGWGAVVNEAMNSGCAVIASHVVGAAPFLIDNKKNGLIYRDNKIQNLTKKVEYLLGNPMELHQIGKCAYKTIISDWNAENAAQRFTVLCKHLMQNMPVNRLFMKGICSVSPRISSRWKGENVNEKS